MAEQVAVCMVRRAFLQLIDPLLQRLDALVVLLQPCQKGDNENTHQREAAAADQFQQHATSLTQADADLNGGSQQVVPGCLSRIWIGF